MLIFRDKIVQAIKFIKNVVNNGKVQINNVLF